MLSDSKISGRGAPIIHLEEFFLKKCLLVLASERKEAGGGQRSVIEGPGVGAGGGEPLVLRGATSGKRSCGLQAREMEGPPRVGGHGTCSVSAFQKPPLLPQRRERAAALERCVSEAVSPPALGTVSPSHCPVRRPEHILRKPSHPPSSFSQNRPEISSSICSIIDHYFSNGTRVPQEQVWPVCLSNRCA